MVRTKVANGIFWVEVPEADLRILCGCPADSVKHLARAGLITRVVKNGVTLETGPNAILLSDTAVQKGSFANLAEFPLLQMFYRQGLLIPKHPGNTGRRPLLVGLGDQVRSQAGYFFRGNYGLCTVEEIESFGVPPEAAREMFRVKSWFAFGRIHATEELVDMRPLDADAVTLAPGVVVHRKGFNRYEFIASGESAEVDLTLEPGEEYEPSYALPAACVRREKFSVVHIGEGDGWDHTRPCMGSIICTDGLLYLVDAGPHITRSLSALGLGAGDIEGIFQTHCHDDHFAGLTSLVRSEKRLKYYAVPFVRGSVQKKLSALARIDESSLGRFFDVRDLRLDEWNTIGRLEVRPVLSPHPVDTTVMLFRSGKGKACRTYMHLADIPSLEVLGKLSAPRDGKAALSAASRETFESRMLAAVDVKKVDAGGGLIHGNALDFAQDASARLLLSHGSPGVPAGMPGTARIASFGDVDVLRTGRVPDRQRDTARSFLLAMFPGIPVDAIDTLAASPTREYAPGALLQEAEAPEVLLVVSGTAEEGDHAGNRDRRHGPGALLGDAAGSRRGAPHPALRALSALTVLAIPEKTYRAFAKKAGPARARQRSLSMRGLLALCPLLSPVASESVLNALAAAMEERSLRKGEAAPRGKAPELLLLAEGEVDLTMGAHLVETIGPGGFWGEETLLGGAGVLCEARAASAVRYHAVPAGVLAAIPIVQWGMQESFERRLHVVRSGSRFAWSDSFRVGVPLLDDQHRTLFDLADALSRAVSRTGTIAGHDPEKQELLRFAREHFAAEEALLEVHHYPRLDAQRRAHAELLSLLDRVFNGVERRSRPRTTTIDDYLKDWLIRHTLLEDLRYREFLSSPRTLPTPRKT